MTTKNYPDLSTESGTFLISQIGILGSWAHGTFDSHQIWCWRFYTNSKQHCQKLFASVHRIRYLPYKSNRYTGVLSTWNVRFTPNLIFRLVYQILITAPKIICIGPRDPVPPIRQIGTLGSSVHGTSDSHQISNLDSYTNSKHDYQKLS